MVSTPESMSFRLGTGAEVTDVVKHHGLTAADDIKLSVNKKLKPMPIAHRMSHVTRWMHPIFIMLCIIMMMPSGTSGFSGKSRDFNYRIPPAWSPQNEHNYSFRAFMTDISIWIMLTDLQPHQQCAAIVMRLGGAAKEVARMMTPQEMMNGGIQTRRSS